MSQIGLLVRFENYKPELRDESPFTKVSELAHILNPSFEIRNGTLA